MPRTGRSLLAGGHYHVINRGNNRSTIFVEPADYEAFLWLMARSQRRVELSIFAVCVMPNHFHVVASQRGAQDISRWVHWLLTTHTHRHHRRYGSSGRVWQGRFKAFPIEQDAHLLTVMRYVERNALRAGLVDRAEDWPWGSLAWREGRGLRALLAVPPVTLPGDWRQRVNAPQTADELESLRDCVNRQRPFGSAPWARDQNVRFGRIPSERPRGRPRKAAAITGATPQPGAGPDGKNRRMSPIS